ncbi:reverse transcriptase family protein [Aspergillus affinis]|uniref:reverse transcriptase family protein n=1 Tax=Aspergillus affinis TaxID=1070780 RepID=UPI0022FE43C7|nr:retrotransposon polyprotein [Aspergillus affinis]KAI9041139.1 retrotransposon polyprotein [Aspergillus affinis]
MEQSASDTLPPRRENDHQIELTDKNTLGYSPLYRYSAKELEAIKTYLVKNLHKGFIVSSAAPFGSPVLMAAKPGGSLRFCVDYRKLNSITKKNRYPLPLMDELLDRLGRAKIFTKFDIRQGFYRIRMHPDSVDLITFRTKYGSYKYQVLPFGLTNGPAAFQQLMNDIFIDLIDKYVAVYVNDILIFSLQAAIHKCEFNVKRTKFLGFILTPNGIEVDPEKVAVILTGRFPLQLGDRIARPLYALTKKLASFEWTPGYQEAFEQLKKYLTSVPLLRHHDLTLPSRIETDASDGVIAGIFSQLFEVRWHPIAYFFRNMLGTERNYDIHWLEEGVLLPQATEQKLSPIAALLAPVELDDVQLMDRLLQANRTAADLDEEKAAAADAAE